MAVIETQPVAEAMRAGMRRVAQGVHVISARTAEGSRAAMTASAVTSVSMDPPSLLVCVNQAASIYAPLAQRRPFCVNALALGMEAIANLCAGAVDGEARFAEGGWRDWDEGGVPLLTGCEANFLCQPVSGLEYGTHFVCVANVLGVVLGVESSGPLVYAGGAYCGLVPSR